MVAIFSDRTENLPAKVTPAVPAAAHPDPRVHARPRAGADHGLAGRRRRRGAPRHGARQPGGRAAHGGGGPRRLDRAGGGGLGAARRRRYRLRGRSSRRSPARWRWRSGATSRAIRRWRTCARRCCRWRSDFGPVQISRGPGPSWLRAASLQAARLGRGGVAGDTGMPFAPAHLRGRRARVLVEDDEVEEQLALHGFRADGVVLDALLSGPFDDVLVEQVLGVAGRAFLAVVVDEVGEPLAFRVGRRGAEADGSGNGGSQRDRRRSRAHERSPSSMSLRPPIPSYSRNTPSHA